ncbi:hypothetical protein DFH27DRAFT_600410 [Peziza echinospora]|nr:hypothetical protein DFH27DRAFT_600410 [Peziza echinospora]
MATPQPQPQTTIDIDIDAQATRLASLALTDYEDGKIDDATRNLKHALHLSPQNPHVLATLSAVRSREAQKDRESRFPNNKKKNKDKDADGGDESGGGDGGESDVLGLSQVVELCQRVAVDADAADAARLLRIFKAGWFRDVEGGVEGCVRVFLLGDTTTTTTKTTTTTIIAKAVARLLSDSDSDSRRGKKEVVRVLTSAAGTDTSTSTSTNTTTTTTIPTIAESVIVRFAGWGGSALDAYISVLLDHSLWGSSSAAERERVVRVTFRWIVTHLGGKDDSKPPSLINSTSKILISETSLVAHLMNSSAFTTLLDCTGSGKSEAGAGAGGVHVATATLAVAKYLLESGGPGEALLREYMAGNLLSVRSLRAATALFPLCQGVGGKLFTEGGGEFVGSLVGGLKGRRKKKAKEGRKVGKEGDGAGEGGDGVVVNILRLLSVASAEKTCRGVIAQRCSGVLEEMLAIDGGGGVEEEERGLAAVVLAKLRYATEVDASTAGASGRPVPPPTTTTSTTGKKKGLEELALIFKKMVLQQTGRSRDEAIEGLAYSSLKRGVKEMLAADPPFLKALVKVVEVEGNNANAAAGVLFGALTVIANVAAYPPVLSEEQRKVAQLKKYANAAAAKPGGGHGDDDDDGEDEEKVTARCRRLIDAGAVPALAGLVKPLLAVVSASSSSTGSSTTPPEDPSAASTGPGISSLSLIPTIILSLSHHQPHRPTIAQQGGIKLVLKIITSLSPPPSPPPPPPPSQSSSTSSTSKNRRKPPQPKQQPQQHADIIAAASHALARILVSVNPALTFSAHTTPATTAVRPLIALLKPLAVGGGGKPGPGNDNLKAFEALLALTNLASLPDDPAATGLIERLSIPLLLPLDGVGASSAEDGEDGEEENDDEEEEEVVINPLLLLSTLPALQRAATELLCNICSLDPVFLSGILSSSKKGKRAQQQAKKVVHILLALADAQDYLTRRAASAAVAGLFECAPGVMAGLVLERGGGGGGGGGREGVRVLVGLLCDDGCEGSSVQHDQNDDDGGEEEEEEEADEDVFRVPPDGGQRWEEMVMRGLVCLRGLLVGGGAKAVEKVRAVGGKEVVAMVVRVGVKDKGSPRPWAGEAVEVLRALM